MGGGRGESRHDRHRESGAALKANKFDTVLGSIGFDAKGDVTAPGYVFYVWKDGKYVYAD